MKMKKIALVFMMALATLFTYGQDGIQLTSEVGNSQWVHNDTRNGLVITYNYSLEQNRGTKLSISLSISNGSETVNYGSIVLTSENVLNTSALSKLLKEKYVSLFAQYGRNTLMNHANSLNSMVQNLKDTLNDRNEHSFVYQGLRMFQSIAKGAIRDVNNQGTVNFTVFEGYKNGLNSFECEEDLKFNVSDFKSYLNNRKITDNSNVGIDYYLGALNNVNSGELSFDVITLKLESYFDSQNFPARQNPNGDGTYSKLPQGGQCGCCGNYSGNCYFWSSACLAHDMACQQCQWQACFGGCVPSSCSGNTISWYWFLL